MCKGQKCLRLPETTVAFLKILPCKGYSHRGQCVRYHWPQEIKFGSTNFLFQIRSKLWKQMPPSSHLPSSFALKRASGLTSWVMKLNWKIHSWGASTALWQVMRMSCQVQIGNSSRQDTWNVLHADSSSPAPIAQLTQAECGSRERGHKVWPVKLILWF